MLNFCKKHPLITMIAYFAIYQSTFYVLEFWDRPYTLLESPLDAYIPFMPVAVVPYFAWFAWTPLVTLFLMKKDINLFWVYFRAFAITTASTLFIYLIFPNGLDLRPDIVVDDIFTRIVAFTYAADTSTNVCPSLHTSVTLLVFFFLCICKQFVSRFALILNGALAFLICASTVLLKQHSIIDVFWGAVLAIGVFGAVLYYEKAKQQPIQSASKAEQTKAA